MISVTDPDVFPLPPFNAYMVNPLDSSGIDILDLSRNMRVYARVRSMDTVVMDVLMRSGEGTMDERTDRIAVTVLGGLDTWHEFTCEFNANNLAGFDSLTLRDIWFYLDRGAENFAGNVFYFDYVAIGKQPDPSENSRCTEIVSIEEALRPCLGQNLGQSVQNDVYESKLNKCLSRTGGFLEIL